MMLDSVFEKAHELMRARHMGQNKFSQLLADLVLEASRCQTSGEDKSREQSLSELLELLAENRKLKALIKEKMDGFKLERKGLSRGAGLVRGRP